MILPTEFKQPKAINARLVTKTSLSHPKKAIALILLLWHSNNKPCSIEYGSILNDKLTIKPVLIDKIVNFINQHSDQNLTPDEISNLVTNNPLFDAQIESLNAAFELIWHLASFEFTDPNQNRSAERTGGKRFPKKILFSTNLDIIDGCIERDMQRYISVMLNWLSDGKYNSDAVMEKSIIKILTALAEVSFYKTSKGENGIVFTPSNIYEQLIHNNESVDLCPAGEEIQGPTRIFKALVKENLNPYLRSINHHEITLSQETTPNLLQEYSNRASVSIKLSNIAISGNNISDSSLRSGFIKNISHNLIVFGAPGTGKSHDLNKQAKKYFPNESQITRVTFHPEYTYAQFVGTYKPFVQYHRESMDLPNSGKISYHFECGPFLETYIQALLHPNTNYLLLIEELNRANPAATFGEIFQLLDRDSYGISKYPVATPADMREEIQRRLYEYQKKSNTDCIEFDDNAILKISQRLSLPSNLYLWATMNSADQGVYPMDTAFKRRWNFKYININHNSEEIQSTIVSLGKDKHLVKWDTLRREINRLLLDECKVNEDKLIGPFFISPEFLNQTATFNSAFKDKVLLYLCEDAAKMKRPLLFKGCIERTTITYSYICEEFDSKGEGIFGLNLRTEL